ncbi:transglutaminase domain-containing protein [Ruminococcus sp.]|uniref:transglutaminase domain-containing protein n=1 Tax=Ruminococcus sp. TaxID=41978 RepID=UPI0025CE506F|nr:transglutaminase domain-containing protein [Ruminococcus sp.]
MKLPFKAAALLSAAVLAFAALPPFSAAAAQLSVPEISGEYVLSSESEAIQQLRQSLKDHSESVEIVLPDNGEEPKEKSYQLLYGAFDETGKGTEGDYLRFSIQGFKCSISKENNERHFLYSFRYYTTQEEEAELTEKLDELMSSQNFDGISGNYNKIRSIYQYITSSVEYSENEEDPYAFTAYSALLRGTAVCQGVTQLLYRMYNDCGIPCRIIAGETVSVSGSNRGNHVWLIVKLDEQYYYLDPTWDMKFGGKSFYYFLKGSNDLDSAAPRLQHIATNADQKTFPDYASEEFAAAYPIAKEAYKAPEYSQGDINGDKLINAVDASLILAEYARSSTGCFSSFSTSQSGYADVDSNGIIDAVDASIVLSYYTQISNGSDISLSDFIKNLDRGVYYV